VSNQPKPRRSRKKIRRATEKNPASGGKKSGERRKSPTAKNAVCVRLNHPTETQNYTAAAGNANGGGCNTAPCISGKIGGAVRRPFEHLCCEICIARTEKAPILTRLLELVLGSRDKKPFLFLECQGFRRAREPKNCDEPCGQRFVVP